ncbi:hypothetical protein G4X40_19955 [Rhodococcus sp. D2-41]|uniref:Uncharacterized protein n=1 Tax=Speluncibacter jeojiensis TaxID=2710754 RepID=A0A9X4M1T2_9ACTN|nr:hypothetical protein [Rhodococcus sp. D2-41]MDG3012418.1 hypothetical protein [Rhodococcus sp. D2-41]MDG3013593.1 hypothetical protein [Corynebacteriales bacterium D3-21]
MDSTTTTPTVTLQHLERFMAKLDELAEDVVLDDARVATLGQQLDRIEKTLRTLGNLDKRLAVVERAMNAAARSAQLTSPVVHFHGGRADRDQADLIRAAAEAMSAALADFLLLAMKGN